MDIKKNIEIFLKNNVSLEKSRFAIYPYGYIGHIVEDCLHSIIGESQIICVDNSQCKFSEKIISIGDFKKIYTNEIIVFLAVEKRELNDLMYNQLVEFIPRDMIINVLDLKWNPEKAMVSYFLPNCKESERIKVNNKKKIKVRMLHTWKNLWNCYSTICDACLKDPTIDLQIVLRTQYLTTTHMADLRVKYNCINLEEYNVKEDQPDVFVLVHIWDFSEVKNIRDNARIVILASMSLIPYLGSNFACEPGENYSEYCDFLKKTMHRYRPDYYLFDSYIYNRIKEPFESKLKPAKLVEMGNAKYDGIYLALKKSSLPEKWSKLQGKKIILWTTGHGIHLYNGNLIVNKFLTFDIYAKYIFDCAQKHPELGFIFRPNLPLISEMKECMGWSDDDVKILIDYCDKADNIVFDDTETYDIAYSVADAILSESGCGILASALPTMKPIGVLYRSVLSVEYDTDITNKYYTIHNTYELTDFINMINNGDDPKFEMRVDAARAFVKHFDGKNGWRIKEFIKEVAEKKR